MIPIPPRLIGYGLVVLAIGGYVMMCERTKTNMAKAQAIAEQQQVENAKKALRDIQAKERSDENYQRRIARLAADVKRLRDARPSLLPEAVPTAGSAVLACFDRGELDTALRKFDSGVADLVVEGDAARIAIDEAKRWAESVAR